MIRRLCMTSVTAAATAIMLGFSASIASQATPPQEQFVGELIDKAIKFLELPVEERAQREAGFRALLNQNFDMPTIVRLVLGRHWRTATPRQKSRFARVFKTHLLQVYTSQLGLYQGETIEIEKSAPLSKKDTVIYTLILRDGEIPLRVDWRVRETNHGLKVIDVVAEGVSMLTTKRSEFTSVVAREGVDALIGRLEDLNIKIKEASES